MEQGFYDVDKFCFKCHVVTALFPNVMVSLGDRIFPEDNFKFLFEVLTILQKQRANSSEVIPLYYNC